MGSPTGREADRWVGFRNEGSNALRAEDIDGAHLAPGSGPVVDAQNALLELHGVTGQDHDALDERLGWVAGVVEHYHVSPGRHPTHLAAAADLLAAGRRRLSLVDCINFETMRRLGICTAFTFDTHFDEQGFGRIAGRVDR